MNAGLFWTIIGSVAGVFGVGLGAWQVRLQRREHHGRRPDNQPPERPAGGLPVTVPLGRLPAEIRGRDGLLTELQGVLRRRSRRNWLPWPQQGNPDHTWVLAGMGGLGKSTMALAAAQMARTKGWRVWWVTATDTASLSGGMLSVLRQLHAPAAVAQAVQEGAPVAADHVWEFLNGPHRAGRRWLLIFDSADNPSVLAAPGESSPADHTGWLRADPVGMVLVTTRNTDARVWGSGVVHHELAPLDDAAAAKILTDLAPAVPDPDGRQARDLGYRLGCLPLALHLAGSYLASPFAGYLLVPRRVHAQFPTPRMAVRV